jgi:molybdopterin converting factor small subunit
MRVSVLLFSVLRDAVGRGALDVDLPEGSSGADLIVQLARTYAPIQQVAGHVRLGINQRYTDPGTPLHEGDEVALITPTSGG